MEETGLFKNRKVVPRWREIERTHSSELASTKNLIPKIRHSDDTLNFYYKKWQEDQSIENASEVIDVAILAKDKSLAYGPAEQILKSKDILPAVKAVAQYIKTGGAAKTADNFEDGFANKEEIRSQISGKIKKLKERTRNEPRNAFLWLEIARLNSWVGHNKNAEIAIKRAFGAAPESRFVLRAIARFFTHINQPDDAYGRIQKSDAIKSDPWVQSAEIALAGLIGKTPKSIKFARENLRRKHLRPIHTSELASALATEELITGRKKIARDLFKDSLIDPTDNSLAQALWARDKVSVNIQKDKLLTDRAFEARAHVSLATNEYEDALMHCALWAQDEPFSLGPAMEGSQIAIGFLDDYSKAILFVDQGLFANPAEYGLWNNGAVAYARAGKLEEARRYFQHIAHRTKQENPEPTFLATRGLLSFRSGDWEEGRLYYEKSLSSAIKNKTIDVAFRAKFHWLYEEVFAGTLEQNYIIEKLKELDNEEKKLSPHLTLTTKALWSRMKGQIEGMIKNYKSKGESLFSPKMMLKIDN